MTEPFTLESLLELLAEDDYQVVSSGPDDRPELGPLRYRTDFPFPPPRFFASVEVDGAYLVPPLTDLVETVWAKFGRGPMEFRADSIVERNVVRIVITQTLKTADGTYRP